MNQHFLFSYTKEFSVFSSIENSDTENHLDKSLINSEFQLYETNVKKSFEIDNLKKYISNHLKKITLIQTRIDEINEIKISKYLIK